MTDQETLEKSTEEMQSEVPKMEYSVLAGLVQRVKDAALDPWCGVQIIDLDKGTCVD